MSLVYSKANKASIDKAVEKAKLLHPRVKVLDYGIFEVEGRTGKYLVKFVRDENGQFVPECNCKAGQHSLVCYHGVACSGTFKLQAREKAQAEKKEARLLSEMEEEAAVEEAARLMAAYVDETKQQCIQCHSFTTTGEAGYCEFCEADWARIRNAIEAAAEKDAVEELYTEEMLERDRADLFGD